MGTAQKFLWFCSQLFYFLFSDWILVLSLVYAYFFSLLCVCRNAEYRHVCSVCLLVIYHLCLCEHLLYVHEGLTGAAQFNKMCTYYTSHYSFLISCSAFSGRCCVSRVCENFISYMPVNKWEAAYCVYIWPPENHIM